MPAYQWLLRTSITTNVSSSEPLSGDLLHQSGLSDLPRSADGQGAKRLGDLNRLRRARSLKFHDFPSLADLTLFFII